MELNHGVAKSCFSTSPSQNGMFSFQWEIKRFYELQFNYPLLTPMFFCEKNGHSWFLKLTVSHLHPNYFLKLDLCNQYNGVCDLDFTITVSQNYGKSFYVNTGTVSSIRNVDLVPNIKLPRSLWYDFLNITCSIKVKNENIIDSHSKFVTIISEVCSNPKKIEMEFQTNQQMCCASNQIRNNSGEAECQLKLGANSSLVQKKVKETIVKVPTCNSKQSHFASTDNITDNSPDIETLKQLSIDLKRILIQAKNTDITIRIEDSIIKVHKAILCARSPVFCRMFEHSTLETVNKEIEVTDIRASVMQKLISYLYSGERDRLQYEEACELYYAADKYEILNLREACMKDLLCLIDVNNACAMLSLANCHGDDVFKDKIMDFISKNFKGVVNTEEWINLTEKDTKLAAFLMRYCAQVLTE